MTRLRWLEPRSRNLKGYLPEWDIFYPTTQPAGFIMRCFSFTPGSDFRGKGGGGRRVLGPQLGTDAWTKDRWKDRKQCVPNFCENKPFRSVFRENCPSHCLANFDNPEHSVIFSITTWKTDSFLQKLYYSYPKRWQRCALPSCFFVQASVPSWVASAPPPPPPGSD